MNLKRISLDYIRKKKIEKKIKERSEDYGINLIMNNVKKAESASQVKHDKNI